MSAEDLSEQIKKTAQGPQSVTSDGTTVVQPNLKDLIEADRYLSKKSAARSPWALLRIARIQSPGSVQ